MTDIFDTKADDLPDTLKNKFNRKNNKAPLREAYINFFRQKNPLTINEMMAAVYRTQNRIVSRQAVYSLMLELRNKGLVRLIDLSTYQYIGDLT